MRSDRQAINLAAAASVLVSIATTLAACGSGASNDTGGIQSYWLEETLTDLRFPSSIEWLPNGDALVTEMQNGVVLISSGQIRKPIAGLPPAFTNAYNGYKEIIVDRHFSTNRTVFLLISEGSLHSHFAAVYRARLENNQLVDLRRLYRSKDSVGGIGAIAGRMIQLSDGTLLFGVTDDGKHNAHARNLASDIGKTIRINVDGSIPKNNPLRSRPGALPQIWSFGHRNPYGLHEDVATGEIWEVEPAAKGGDELNRLSPGHDYGWPMASWSFAYNDSLVGPKRTDASADDPIFVWTPSITPSGLTQYRGHEFPAWRGDYFLGGLSGRTVERLRVENGEVTLRERLLINLGERVRDVATGPDGGLYVLTDNASGRVLRFRPGSASRNARIARRIEKNMGRDPGLKFGNATLGRATFEERCSGCHSAGPHLRGGSIGPDLQTVYGRRAASIQNFAYSKSMTTSQRIWDQESLDGLIADPDGYIPGTTMGAPPMHDAQDRANVIAFLAHVSGRPK